jgi:tetratricopeptide (TPR) repeat protein
MVNAYILAFILISFSIVHAQKDIRKADKQLELKAYELAIKSYQSFIEHNPDNSYAQVKLAEAYRQTNDLLKAIFWYEKAFGSNADLAPQHLLNYAHSLKKLGLYERAKNTYNEYASIDSDLAQIFYNGCDVAIELLKADDQYEIALFGANSAHSDFGVAMVGQQAIFSSFRKDLSRSSEKQNLSYIQNIGNQLYRVDNKTQIEKKSLQFLRPEFKEIYGIGPISYSEDGKMVAFTKNNFSDGAIQPESNETDLSIYLAYSEQGNDFGNEYPFPYNQVEFSYAYPHLVFKGSALYFASNRPGGLGGFDIYVSYYKDNEWSKPENLGKEINTSADEITPFFAEEKLYFASNQAIGLGGYDVFTSEIKNGKWSKSENMGKGINSPADDYYFSKSHETFYFTSNRLGGKGKDDIYMANKLSNEGPALASVPNATQLEKLASEKVEEDISGDLAANSNSPREVSVSESEKIENVSRSLYGDLNNSDDFKLYDHYELDLTGAIKAGTTDVVDPSVSKYFIQIASLSKSKGSINDFEDLRVMGQIYRFYLNNSIKIRLGSFDSKIDADMILAKVRRAGYRDAFITSAVLSNTNFELLGDTNVINYYENKENEAGSEYKIRLASYSNPLWFDTKELKHLEGSLEQWTKGHWTIFILSGFDSLEKAESARIKAVNRGFKEAEVVIDDRGVLKRLNRN